jgi:hypothetical protein
MRVLVTASREWSWPEILHGALTEVYREWTKNWPHDREFVVVHGGARGGDTMADEWARAAAEQDPRVRPEEHSANWERHGLSAGHIRNQEMIDTKIDRCLAFPWGTSTGTRGCMKLAKKARIPVQQFQPKLW